MSYESTAYSVIRQTCGRELGPDAYIYIPNAYFTAAGASSFTSTNFLQDTGKGTGQWNGWAAFRGGSATAADNWRPLGDLTNSTGVVAQRGPTTSDTTVGSEDLELWNYLVRADQEIKDAINQALKEEYIKTGPFMLSHLFDQDGGMYVSTDTNWTDVGTPTTSTKVTTGSRTPYGPYSYRLVGDATNEGTRSASVTIRQSGGFSAYAIASCASGTATFQPYDSTNSGTTGMPDALSHSEQEPQLFAYVNQIAPTTCKSIALNMLGSTNPSDIYWNQAGIYVHDNLIIHMPSFISEGFKSIAVFKGVPQYGLPSSNYVWDAQSLDMVELTEGRDYFLMMRHADANPYAIRFRDATLYQNPLFIEVERPAYDIVASGAGFSAESDTFPGALKTFIPRCMLQILDRIYIRRFGKSDPQWASLRQGFAGKLSAALAVRPVESVAKVLPYYAGPARRM